MADGPVAAAVDKVVFPYASLKEATKDKFARIGGPDQAFRFMKQGYKFLAWTRRTHKRRREREAAADRTFAKENGRS